MKRPCGTVPQRWRDRGCSTESRSVQTVTAGRRLAREMSEAVKMASQASAPASKRGLFPSPVGATKACCQRRAGSCRLRGLLAAARTTAGCSSGSYFASAGT